jgi:hypothetical protein
MCTVREQLLLTCALMPDVHAVRKELYLVCVFAGRSYSLHVYSR